MPDAILVASPSKAPVLSTNTAVTSAAGVSAMATGSVMSSNLGSGSGSTKEHRLSRKMSVASLLFGVHSGMEGDVPSAMEFVVKVRPSF